MKESKPIKQKNNITVVLSSIYLSILLFVFPIFTVNGYNSITEDKFRFLCIATLVTVAIILLVTLELWIIKASEKPKAISFILKNNLIQSLILCYGLMALVSSLVSNWRELALIGSSRRNGFITLAIYIVLFVIISNYCKTKAWMLTVFNASMVFTSIIGLVQLAGKNPLGLYPEGVNYYDANIKYSGEFLTTIGNSDMMAAVICVAIGINACVIVLSIINKKLIAGKLHTIVSAVSLLVLIVFLFKSSVRAGMVATLASPVIMAPLFFKGKGRIIVVIILILCLVLSIAAVFFWGNRIDVSTINETYEILHGNVDPSFGSGRIYIWREMIKLVPERLLLGSGPDTIKERSSVTFSRYDENQDVEITVLVDDAHNEYLQTLLCNGLIGLVLYLSILLCILYKMLKNDNNSYSQLALFWGMMSYLIQAFFGLSSPVSTPFLWIVMALLVSEMRNANSKRVLCV